MSFAGWALFALLSIWYIGSQRLSHKKRLHLRSYVIFLLLNDDTREDHKRKLGDWIRESAAKSPRELHTRTDSVIENMADRFAVSGNSLLAAMHLLWESEAASNLRARATQP